MSGFIVKRVMKKARKQSLFIHLNATYRRRWTICMKGLNM